MNSDSDSEGAAMAAAMGFSSFGGKPAAKKRKFNPSTDAFVEGQALEKLDRGGKKGTGSGGNMQPLGKTRVIGKKQGEGKKVVENRDEIALDEDEDEDEEQRDFNEVRRSKTGSVGKTPKVNKETGLEHRYLERATDTGADSSEGEGPQYIDTSRTPPAEEQDEPRYIDTSMPAPMEQEPVVVDEISQAEKDEMQRRIDAIFASIETDPPPPSNNTDPTLPTVLSTFPPASTDLTNRPAFLPNSDTAFMQGASRGRFRGGSDAGSSRGGRSEAGSSRGGRERGQRNEKWYEEYYDPNFNANPWEALEKAKNLEPMGTWIEYPKDQGRGGWQGQSV